MKKKFYEELYLLEEKHWWLIAKREISLQLLKRFVKKKGIKLLDIGCGTGKNIEILSMLGKTWGIDKSREAINYCKKRGIKNIKIGKAEETGFRKNSFDVIVMLDVLEHVDDDRTLKEIYRILKPKGLLIISVPAYQSLWSKWDEALHHKRRYDKKSLQILFKKNKLKVKKISYMFSFLLPPVFLLRKVKSLLFSNDYPSDFRLAPPLINSLMLNLSRLEHKLVLNNSVPFGTSIVCVLRKNES